MVLVYVVYKYLDLYAGNASDAREKRRKRRKLPFFEHGLIVELNERKSRCVFRLVAFLYFSPPVRGSNLTSREVKRRKATL